MKPALVRKNTEGGAGDLVWEAGEVKELNPYFADELIKLAPGDYELVRDGEHTPDPPVHNAPDVSLPVLSTDGTGIKVTHPESTVVEVAAEVARSATQTRVSAKKSNKTETTSAE